MQIKPIILVERIENYIYIIRGQRVMLDQDLAVLYNTTTKRLNEQVKRNLDRFPDDFMFQLSAEELQNWRSQIATSKPNTKMGLRRRPYAFTEHGALMLANVLKSEYASRVSVQVVRAFIYIRQFLSSHETIINGINELKSFVLKHSCANDQEFKKIWNAIEKLSTPPPKPVNDRPMGFDLGYNRK